jgi:hypothetical protein
MRPLGATPLPEVHSILRIIIKSLVARNSKEFQGEMGEAEF